MGGLYWGFRRARKHGSNRPHRHLVYGTDWRFYDRPDWCVFNGADWSVYDGTDWCVFNGADWRF